MAISCIDGCSVAGGGDSHGPMALGMTCRYIFRWSVQRSYRNVSVGSRPYPTDTFQSIAAGDISIIHHS